jgi:DNA-binding GntR family transcriptional regulator
MELRDLGDMYAITSGGGAALAAARASADDLRMIREARDQLVTATDAGQWRRADARFRVLIAVAAQSPRLYRAEIELQAQVGILLWLVFDDSIHTIEQDACAQLVAAIEQRRTDVARAVAERRVREATARLIDHRLSEEYS